MKVIYHTTESYSGVDHLDLIFDCDGCRTFILYNNKNQEIARLRADWVIKIDNV